MDSINDRLNMGSMFKRSASLPPRVPSTRPVSNMPPAMPSGITPLSRPEQPKSKPQTPKPAPGFELVNFSKSGVVNNDNLYKDNFRYKTKEALRSTLKRDADRSTVANLLWDRRGNGLNRDEIKFGLRKLEKSGKLTPGQVKAVRRKMNI